METHALVHRQQTRLELCPPLTNVNNSSAVDKLYEATNGSFKKHKADYQDKLRDMDEDMEYDGARRTLSQRTN